MIRSALVFNLRDTVSKAHEFARMVGVWYKDEDHSPAVVVQAVLTRTSGQGFVTKRAELGSQAAETNSNLKQSSPRFMDVFGASWVVLARISS